MRPTPKLNKFNPGAVLPFELRVVDVQLAMQDIYDFLWDVNAVLRERGLPRLEESVRPAIFTGMLSDLLASSLAKHSRALVENRYPNGHPDLLRRGAYPGDRIDSGTEGVEVKATSKRGGAVDTHGARDQWMCVFVYEPPAVRDPDSMLVFREVYLGQVASQAFRKNARGELGTRTATLNAEGIAGLRQAWIYLDLDVPIRGRKPAKPAPLQE